MVVVVVVVVVVMVAGRRGERRGGLGGGGVGEGERKLGMGWLRTTVIMIIVLGWNSHRFRWRRWAVLNGGGALWDMLLE